MNVEKFLHEHDMKATRSRKRIVEILSHENKPISYDEILCIFKADKATFYRNMQTFEEAGIITKIQVGQKAYYELTSSKKAYFVCDICHKMTNIDIKIPSVAKSVKNAVINGVCKNCND